MMRILILNLSASSSDEVNNALAGQGYEIAVEAGLDVEQIESFGPELLITEATPSDLSCCGIITQIKSREQTKSIRVLMVVQGGALERARALDLGADDVISAPFEFLEFAAKVRTQFRERQPEVELRNKLKQAEQKEHLAGLAVETLSGGAVTRKRLWVLPALFILSIVAVVAALVTSLTYRRSRTDTLQLKAELARLSRGVVQQSDLLRRAEDERHSLDRLESEGKIAETIVRSYGSSVCLLHVVVEFLDRGTGKPILIAVDGLGKPLMDDKGMVQLDTDGNGPHLQLDVFGTGFLVRKDGRLITNHHVAEPWWGNDELKALIDHGASAYALSYMAYFPGSQKGISAKLDKISTQADVATLRLEGGLPARSSLLDLDDRSDASVPGEAVVLIGYPTGIEGILARAGPDATKEITGNTSEVKQIVSHLAEQKLIRPTTTQGHIGDVLQDKIVYDAATTSGGSGGPLFNRNGKVIGVNFAILSGFGGSNLAVPVKYAINLLN